jgi:hypothetical protein
MNSSFVKEFFEGEVDKTGNRVSAQETEGSRKR